MEPSTDTEVTKKCGLCPMTIPLVVEKMMLNLDLATLAECRLVCDQYREMATSLLMKRNINHFELTFSKDSDCYYIERHQILDHHNEKVFFDPLNNLNQLSTATTGSSDNETSFHLFGTEFRVSGGSLSSPDLRRFFSLHGHNIQKLHLNFNRDDDNDDNNYGGVENFRKLLLSKAPNLYHLHIKQLPKKWILQPLFSELEINWRGQLQLLQNLTILSVNKLNVKNSPLIGDLILMGQNLKELHNCPTAMMCKEDPRLLEKMGLVKSFEFQPEPSNWAFCCQLSDLTSNLTTLSLTLDELYHCPESWPGVTKTINNIFQRSLTTLVNFGTEQLGFLSGLDLPAEFENVEKLSIKFWKEPSAHVDDWRLFPKNKHYDEGEKNSLSKLFPKVSKLKFKVFLVDDNDDHDSDEDEDPSWGDLVSGAEGMPAVEFLEFRDQMLDGRWLVRFANLCLFVTTLKLGTYSVALFPEFCVIAGRFFKWVETLYLFTDDGYGGYDELEEIFTAQMDSSLTGITVPDSATMRNVPADHMSELLFEDDVALPSLLALRHLTSFIIEFPPVPSYCECKNLSMFSHVSGVLGFGAMKNRKPEFKLKIIATRSPQMEQMLTEIGPFVDTMVWKHG